MSRRQLLASAAALAASAAVGPRRVSGAAPGQAVKVLIEDIRQDGQDFEKGLHLGTRVSGGALSGDGVFQSVTLEAPFAFTHAGLHWQGNAAGLKGASFEARTSADGSTWTGWTALHVEAAADDTPSGETFAYLVGAPRHRYLEYRVALGGGGQINAVTATFLNSVDGPVIAAPATALIGSPVIDFSREDWGCDESLRFRGKREIWPRMFVPVKKLVLHHTASGAYTDGAAEVRAIYTYHAVSQGWGDIGYNALVDVWGNSYEGRYSRDLPGGREVFGADVVAGHALGYNYGTCGIAAIGNFEDDPLPTDTAMLDKLKRLFAFRGREREIDPNGSSHFLQSGGTWSPAPLPNVFGHKDCNATACPGRNLYPMLSEISRYMLETQPMATAPVLAGPDGPSAPAGNSMSFLWSGPAGMQFASYLEGWYKASSSENITYLRGFDSAKYPLWSDWSASTSAQFSSLPDGHYTFHVRGQSSNGETYQANKTVLVQGPGSGGKKR